MTESNHSPQGDAIKAFPCKTIFDGFLTVAERIEILRHQWQEKWLHGFSIG